MQPIPATGPGGISPEDWTAFYHPCQRYLMPEDVVKQFDPLWFSALVAFNNSHSLSLFLSLFAISLFLTLSCSLTVSFSVSLCLSLYIYLSLSLTHTHIHRHKQIHSFTLYFCHCLSHNTALSYCVLCLLSPFIIHTQSPYLCLPFPSELVSFFLSFFLND